MGALLALLTAATYVAPEAMRDPDMACAWQYIGRGLLGCVWALALWQRWVVSWATCLSVLVWEAATVVCTVRWANMGPTPDGICDAATGLPWVLPAVALTMLAVVIEVRRG